MKKNFRYYIYLLIAVVVFVLFEMSKPTPISWFPTFSKYDKNPYGDYVLNDLLQTDGIKVAHSNKTIYEIAKEEEPPKNLLILAEDFVLDSLETVNLLELVRNGTNAFIAAANYSGKFADTLNLEISNLIINDTANLGTLFRPLTSQEDSTAIYFVNKNFEKENFYFKNRTIPEYFTSFDTANAKIIAMNDLKAPVMIGTKFGKGKIIVSSTPLAFTNYYLLWNNNHKFISSTFSHLPKEDILWTEYYQLGRMEAQTSLRFILKTEALRWAYYIAISSLILFIIFEAKRRQRIIPIMLPPKNDTLVFAETVGNLYYDHGDHKDIALKKITYFKEHIRTKYYLPTNDFNEIFFEQLSHKSGNDLDVVKRLFTLIGSTYAQEKISETQLMKLNNEIDKFINS